MLRDVLEELYSEVYLERPGLNPAQQVYGVMKVMKQLGWKGVSITSKDEGVDKIDPDGFGRMVQSAQGMSAELVLIEGSGDEQKAPVLKYTTVAEVEKHAEDYIRYCFQVKEVGEGAEFLTMISKILAHQLINHAATQIYYQTGQKYFLRKAENGTLVLIDNTR